MAAKKSPKRAAKPAVAASSDLMVQMRTKNNRLIERLHQLKLEMDSIMQDLCEPPPGCDPPPPPPPTALKKR